MEIALIVVLFLVGTVGGAMQALKYLERRQRQLPRNKRSPGEKPSGES
jgi:uncharacterized protein YneF (UPF0154 family)